MAHYDGRSGKQKGDWVSPRRSRRTPSDIAMPHIIWNLARPPAGRQGFGFPTAEPRSQTFKNDRQVYPSHPLLAVLFSSRCTAPCLARQFVRGCKDRYKHIVKRSRCARSFDNSEFVEGDNGIGALFRDFGEQYISIYKPSITKIKLIRSIRVCKTPALGGTRYTCKGCQKETYVYFGCGNSRCPKCQGVKRLQWQDKLATKILRCPYQHIVFTLPHRLNGLARRNPTQIYNCLMRSAWSSFSRCAREKNNLGALPGAIMVLHTFGSDLKYHVHVHVLVTFGGMSDEHTWCWPKRKNKIVPYRQIRGSFRADFLKRLTKIYDQLEIREPLSQLTEDLLAKSWCVHAEPPTADTKVVQEYLGRYICRIGLSKNRFHYDKVHKQVTLSYKDYRNRTDVNVKIPMATKNLNPLVAIDQIMAHCLPPYFQKCRYYGLHASATFRKVSEDLPTSIKNNTYTVRSIFQILKAMLGLEALVCDKCQSTEFDKGLIMPNRFWKYSWLKIPHNRGSPENYLHIDRWTKIAQLAVAVACNKGSKSVRNHRKNEYL